MKKHLLPCALLSILASTPAQAELVNYTIDPTHTFVTFEVTHMGTSTSRGRFDRKEGTVQLDRVAKTGKADIPLDATALSTGIPAFDKHLQGSDFFNSAKFPTITFSTDKFCFGGNKGTQVTEVAGQLTLLGKTNPVTLQAKHFNCYHHPMLGREVCGGDFEATIDRTQWGMGWGINFGVPASVKLVVQVEAIKQNPPAISQ